MSQVEETKKERKPRGKKPAAAAAAEGETKADNRPKTAGRGKRSGADGAAGKDGNKDNAPKGENKNANKRRPQTARDAANEAEGNNEDKKEERKGDGNRGGKGNNNKRVQKEQDKNSWIYKYHNMPRPQYEKIAFTAETVIPELPAKKDILKEPSKADFEREMALQDTKIAEKRQKKDDFIQKKRRVREGGLTNGGDKTKKGELTEKINEAKGIRATKRTHQDAMRDIVAQMEGLETEKRNLLKTMHANCHTVDQVNDEMKELNRRLTTTSMKATEESRVIKELEKLRASIPSAKRFSRIEPDIKELKTKKNKIWGEIKVIRGQEDILNAEMEKIREAMAQTDSEKSETFAQLDAIQKQIEGVDEELTALYAAKDEKREAYWKARYDQKLQKEEMTHIEWMQRQKDKVLQNQAQKAERTEERKAAISSLPHPYHKELDCCEHLVNYMNSLKARAGLIVDNEAVARAAQSQMQAEVIKEKLDAKLAAGKVQITQNKAERDAQNVLQIGGQSKKKGKKRKEAVEYEDSFNLELIIIQKFAFLGISVPVVTDDLDNRIGLVEEKKQWYKDNGADKLQEQIDQFERMADEEDKEFEQDVVVEEQPDTRGGRGGRGSRGGYRGGRGGSSRGRGRGGIAAMQVRDEFEGDDDDDFMYSAPVKGPKKQKQKQEDLKLDDSNYPSLM